MIGSPFELNFTCFEEGAVACASFTIVNDSLIEATEFFRVTLDDQDSGSSNISLATDFIYIKIQDSG